jgi:hypothetical protein
VTKVGAQRRVSALFVSSIKRLHTCDNLPSNASSPLGARPIMCQYSTDTSTPPGAVEPSLTFSTVPTISTVDSTVKSSASIVLMQSPDMTHWM